MKKILVFLIGIMLLLMVGCEPKSKEISYEEKMQNFKKDRVGYLENFASKSGIDNVEVYDLSELAYSFSIEINEKYIDKNICTLTMVDDVFKENSRYYIEFYAISTNNMYSNENVKLLLQVDKEIAKEISDNNNYSSDNIWGVNYAIIMNTTDTRSEKNVILTESSKELSRDRIIIFEGELIDIKETDFGYRIGDSN